MRSIVFPSSSFHYKREVNRKHEKHSPKVHLKAAEFCISLLVKELYNIFHRSNLIFCNVWSEQVIDKLTVGHDIGLSSFLPKVED